MKKYLFTILTIVLLFGVAINVVAEKLPIQEVLVSSFVRTPLVTNQAQALPTPSLQNTAPTEEHTSSADTPPFVVTIASPPPATLPLLESEEVRIAQADDTAPAVDDILVEVAPAPAPVPDVIPQEEGNSAVSAQQEQWYEIGEASWYGGRFQGRQTANGEIFDTNLLTAAHQTLPFNTIVRVYNPLNGKSVLVRINDRGPFIDDRIIDLSRAAAIEIDTARLGVAEVYLQIVELGKEKTEVTIQMASFLHYENATDMVNDLKRDGFTPKIETVDSTLHRVVLANVHRDQVDELRRQLDAKGYGDVLVRTR